MCLDAGENGDQVNLINPNVILSIPTGDIALLMVLAWVLHITAQYFKGVIAGWIIAKEEKSYGRIHAAEEWDTSRGKW